MKKQIGICALIAVLVLVAVGWASFTAESRRRYGTSDSGKSESYSGY